MLNSNPTTPHRHNMKEETFNKLIGIAIVTTIILIVIAVINTNEKVTCTTEGGGTAYVEYNGEIIKCSQTTLVEEDGIVWDCLSQSETPWIGSCKRISP